MITGIVGKPNTGKSTFFNAATLLNVPMASYPFTTVAPNFGVGYVRVDCVCRKLGVQDNPVNSRCVDGNRLIPVKLIDVAGLVPGASQGRGLGNKFLDELRRADALIHVVDASGCTDEEGRLCSPGTHDPIADVEFVEKEFDAWMLQIILRDWVRMARTAEAGAGKLGAMMAERLSGLSIREELIVRLVDDLGLKTDKPTTWKEEDLRTFISVLREKAKPMVVAANKADLPSAKDNVDRLRASDHLVVPCAAEAELLLRRASERNLIQYIPGDKSFTMKDEDTLSPEQKKALQLVEERVLQVWGSTGVQQCLNSAYLNLLDSIVVFPVEDEAKLSDKKGNVLPDAYLVKKGSTAKDLAYAIHTDLGESFLHAVDAKTGLRLGADYTLKDSDVIKIVSAARRA